MRNDIEAAFSRRQKPLLMTHVVAGYPDLDRSRETVEVMVENGAGLVEIQIPFTDPLADGPTITAANRDALKNGVRPKDCLAMVRQLKKRISTPILVMTYGNIPYRMGLERFAAGFGVSRPEHVRLLRNKVDAVVIGSRLLHLYNIGGLKGVASFLRLCRRELDSSG